MKALTWLLVAGALAGVAYFIARMRQQWAERQRAAEARFAARHNQFARSKLRDAIPYGFNASQTLMP